MILLFGALGLAQGLALGLPRRDLWKLPAWCVLGLAGGLLSYGLDYFYNYQHAVYKLVWWLAGFFFPSSDNRATRAAYGLLQSLRFWGTALPLLLAAAWGQRGVFKLKAGLFLALASLAIYNVRGALLVPALSVDFLGQISLYLWHFFSFLRPEPP